ncbi:glycosyltransferase family 2 protein [Flavobacterium sp. 14A]|uniref:glycosyltransferase family 2 protein n=1 Tax=Flavobacterium sp. 14A TaxID=2735896 RepID=UPI0015713A25|nr:glycosyltransferase family 2 protein [Flavobacterium sp. 14A]NRT13282.1 GT2 family glycosyltransferase [Flavobacterium sp. 14A]
MVYKDVAVLITCHNRKDKTLACLEAFYKCFVPEGYKFIIFLVDDGSSDGTREAITIKFPNVNIVQGDGNLYWNRGMRLAWDTATKAKDFDYYLWLNDDTFLFDDALIILLSRPYTGSIVCGTTQSEVSQKATYGGYSNKPHKLLIPNGEFQECTYLNGNCVLIPKAVFQEIGNLDPIFHHAVGDFDYGLRAKKKGIKLLVAPSFVGTCESHTVLPKWRTASVPLKKRLQSLYLPTSGCSPKQFFVFDKRHNGLFAACFHYFTIHLRAIAPSLWNIKKKLT